MENVKLETYEWIRTWQDHAPAIDLPRVLLVGDSITNGYQEAVRELLAGVCYVDFIATSYYVDNSTYHTIVKALFHSLPYAAVHFNHGLHGIHGDVETYEREMEKLVLEFEKTAKVTLVTSTNVRTNELRDVCPKWQPILEERNAAVERIAARHGCAIDDLYSVSLTVPLEERAKDGVHYTTDGYKKRLAPVVAEAVKTALSAL